MLGSKRVLAPKPTLAALFRNMDPADHHYIADPLEEDIPLALIPSDSEQDEIMEFYPEFEPPQIEGQPAGVNRFEQVIDAVLLKILLPFCSVHELRAIRWGTNKRFYNLFKVKSLHKPQWLSLRESDDVMYYLYPAIEKRQLFQNLREVEFFIESTSTWYALQPLLERGKNSYKIQKLSVYEYQLGYALKCFSADSINTLNVVYETRGIDFDFWRTTRNALREVPNVKVFGFYLSLAEWKSGTAKEADVFLVGAHTFYKPYPTLEQLIVPSARKLVQTTATKKNFPNLSKAVEYNIEWSRESIEQKFIGTQMTVELEIRPVLKRKRVEESDLISQLPHQVKCADCAVSSRMCQGSGYGPYRCLQCLFSPPKGQSTTPPQKQEIVNAIDQASTEAKKLKTDATVQILEQFSLRAM